MKVVETGSNKKTVADENISIAVKKNIVALNEIVGSLIEATSILRSIEDSEKAMEFKQLELSFPKEGIDFYQTRKLFEIHLIKQALQKTGGHQTKSAKLLNMRVTTLNSIIKKHKIEVSGQTDLELFIHNLRVNSTSR